MCCVYFVDACPESNSHHVQAIPEVLRAEAVLAFGPVFVDLDCGDAVDVSGWWGGFPWGVLMLMGRLEFFRSI